MAFIPLMAAVVGAGAAGGAKLAGKKFGMDMFKPTGFLSDPLGIQRKVLGNKTTNFLDDPINMLPKRPTVTQYVGAPQGDDPRRAQGYRAGLMGLSRLTG